MPLVMIIIAMIGIGFLSYIYMIRLDLSTPLKLSHARAMAHNLKMLAVAGLLMFVLGLFAQQFEFALYGLAVFGVFGSVFSRFMEI